MNDRKSKRDEDDDAGMDFELQTHRIERRKKIGINSPSLDHSQLSKEGQDQVHQPLNHNPYCVVYESSCKLRPGMSYSSQLAIPNHFPSNKYNSLHYGEGPFPNFFNDIYCSKCNSAPPPISTTLTGPPPVVNFSQPSSPGVYFQKQSFLNSHSPLSPVLSHSPTMPHAPVSESIPGVGPRIARPASQETIPSDINHNPPSQFPKVTEINIFLKNQVVVCLEVPDAHMVTSRDLLAMIFDEPEIGLPHEAEDTFALWFISPLFEVQLKPEHKPIQVFRKWPDLIAKYTTAGVSQREKDFPYLSLQRDVFYSKKDEMRLGNSVALELLYEEAKKNILSGRYPCDQANAERLAGMQARIELGKYDHDVHTPAFFKARLDNFLPSYACKSKRPFFTFGSKTGQEYKLLLLFRGLQDDVSNHAIMRQYLDHCWSLPYYGSAFFAAQLEKPVTGLAALIGYEDMPVTVGINSEGVSILSPTEGTVLLGLRYQDLSWDSARPVQENNPDCLSCLFLQFQVLEGGQRVFKVLQVFSKQAILMDAIISSFVRALRSRSWDRDEVDDSSTTTPGECTPDADDSAGMHMHRIKILNKFEVTISTEVLYQHLSLQVKTADDAQTPLTTSSLYGSASNDTDNLPSNLQRLSLATFNEDGDCIKLMGSWQFR